MNVSLGVAERRHPKIVCGHGSDQTRRRKNVDTFFDELLISRIQVRHAEIEDRAGMVELRRFGGAKHQAHAAAMKESQGGHGEKQRQTQYMTVEYVGALRVANNEANLATILD